MNVPMSQREYPASPTVRACLSHRAPQRPWADPTASESPAELWGRLFSEYGGADLPDIDSVPDGARQCVYWIDGDVIERVSRNGRWDYDVCSDTAPDSVHGGVSSSGDVPLTGAASHDARA